MAMAAMDARKKKSGGGGGEPLLGKYELGRMLGRGTFAKVYLARAVAGGEAVAVKVIDKAEVMGTAGMAPRVLREVAAMRRLRHPHVLRLHEVLATRARIYLVMELATGGDLLSRLAALPRRRLPESAARRVFVQLVDALSYCHARGVAHRDVKPQNVLLDGDGNLKVSDFGLAALPGHAPRRRPPPHRVRHAGVRGARGAPPQGLRRRQGRRVVVRRHPLRPPRRPPPLRRLQHRRHVPEGAPPRVRAPAVGVPAGAPPGEPPARPEPGHPRRRRVAGGAPPVVQALAQRRLPARRPPQRRARARRGVPGGAAAAAERVRHHLHVSRARPVRAVRRTRQEPKGEAVHDDGVAGEDAGAARPRRREARVRGGGGEERGGVLAAGGGAAVVGDRRDVGGDVGGGAAAVARRAEAGGRRRRRRRRRRRGEGVWVGAAENGAR
ncbi:Os12g0603700 [Oryza sativa Japonica Group]|uniref:Os12g0603700 protein n=1 Tax=Oryza sativa subsp. japonica TaxID=39947 RepID=A0A0P0YC00_ORYSJ|nr:Os12g0603700 [Oryza sativa Japonica Group]